MPIVIRPVLTLLFAENKACLTGAGATFAPSSLERRSLRFGAVSRVFTAAMPIEREQRCMQGTQKLQPIGRQDEWLITRSVRPIAVALHLRNTGQTVYCKGNMHRSESCFAQEPLVSRNGKKLTICNGTLAERRE